MSVNLSKFNVSENVSSVPGHPAQQHLNEYGSWAEMAASVRHSQLSQLGVLAGVCMLILFAYIMYKDDGEGWMQFAAVVTFAVVEVFILAVFRFLLTG